MNIRQILQISKYIKNLFDFFIIKNIQKMKGFATVVIIATFLTLTFNAGIAPVPYCLSKPLYKQFPLVMEQILTHDMDNSFSGYNLNIKLTSNNTFVTLSQKLKELDRINTYFTAIISHYVQKKDNGVGQDSFILYKDITGSVHFSFGRINSKNSLPQYNVSMIVTSDRNVQCFDAALFLDHGIAIVDCLRFNNKPQDDPFTNIFFYLDLTGHTVTKIIQNEVYANFKMVTKRKLARFTHPETHYPYLIRAYLAQGVSQDKDNTYLQFWGAQDPFDLQIFEVVDRTYLHEPKLAINDIQVYNGDIFFLDYFVGLYRLQVSTNHKLLIHGKLKQYGYSKFSVYSNDLDQQTIVALANSHNIYEIDWSQSNMFEHKTINKYTIPSDSQVKDIKINDQYILVQSKANVTDNSNSTYEVDYTWVFTKGSRTYMNAYKVINHNSSKVDIDFDPELNHIYSIDEGGLALFKIDQARLNLHYINQSWIGKTEDVLFTATSTDPRNNKTASCTQKMTVIFSQKQDLTIYPTLFEMNTEYSTNYPGELSIPLDYRFLGPNMTFSIDQVDGKQIPQNWVNKLNSTTFNINTTVKPQDLTFFHTDVLNQYNQQFLIYYFQDTSNKTHVAECIHVWQDRSINCRIEKQYQHSSRISSFATAFVANNQDWDYYYIIGLEYNKNQVMIIDFIRHNIVTNITYQGHQQAQIHNIASSNGYLYVLRKNIKTIDVYSLAQCKEKKACTIMFTIDYNTMKNLGIYYFAPQQLITDSQHPQVLFIKCLGSLIVLDVDNKAKIKLLDQIISSATKDFYFRIAVNKYRMILSAQPDIIQQYSLETIYSKDSLTLMKTYPLYGYKIQPGADIQFSDLQFMVYVNAFDPKANVSVILVYRSGYPASAVLYDTIYLDKLYSRPGFQVEVSGQFVDFVSIAAGDSFKVYRVFQYPTLNLKDPIADFSMNIKASNSKTTLDTNKINVTIVNFPDSFKPTQQFINTLNNLKISNQGNYTWDDRKWFQGHVVNYNYSCQQCDNSSNKSKVSVRQHIDNTHMLEVGGNDFIQTNFGGIGVHQDLFLFRHNGSVSSIINLPNQKLLETCIKVAAFQTQQFVVTACQELGRGISLFIASLQSFKPIVMGPFETDSYHARTLQVVHDVVMVVDQNPYPSYRLLKGSVFLYRVSVNADTYEQFNLLDQIDNDDLLAAHGWDQQDAYIGNAHLTHSVLTDTFRLYITQIGNGFFVIDFTRHAWQNQLHIISIRYIDMNQLLKQNKLHMPTDATFQAITFTGLTSNQHFEMQNILITTKGYHNFEVTIIYDEKDQITSTILHRVYYRYAFYQPYNEIKSISGYVAIGYTLPSIYIPVTNYKRQYVAVYDTNDYPHQSDKGYSERYMLGAFTMNHREPLVFAFNRTYDFHSNGSRIGLIISEPTKNNMYSASLAKNLSLQVKKDFKVGQVLTLTAYSDFSSFSFNMTIGKKNDDDDKDKTDQTLFIIVVSVAALFIVLFGGYIFTVVRKNRRIAATDERQSLVTDTQSFVQDTLPSSNAQYQPPAQNKVMQKEDSGYSSDQQADSGNLKTNGKAQGNARNQRESRDDDKPTPDDEDDTPGQQNNQQVENKPIQTQQANQS